MAEAKKSPDSRGEAPREARADSTSGPALPGRRSFLAVLEGFAAAALTMVLAIPYVRFLLYPVFAKGSKSSWASLGHIDQFSSVAAPVSRFVAIKDEDGWLETATKKPVYVTKNEQGHLQVLTAVCPHLGCTVQWSSSKGKFLCPCHGSVFAPDGAHLAGPAPRGMDSIPIKVVNGQLMVRYENFRELLPNKEVVS